MGASSPSADLFEKGQTVKVSGTSKGKGFQGTVKRHNFSRGPVSPRLAQRARPGLHRRLRHPSRVFKGIRGPGQMGNKRVTQKGLEVVDVLPDRNLLLCAAPCRGPRAAPSRSGADD